MFLDYSFLKHKLSLVAPVIIIREVIPLSITFTSNGKREFVPRDQDFPLFVVYCSLFLHINK